MSPRDLLEILTIAERLKDTTRHCYTSKGRHESVAEHTWMMTFMAFLLSEEFPDIDMNKVLEMCIIHDLGECFTGDIPTFDKTIVDSKTEEALLVKWIDDLPSSVSKKLLHLYEEMKEIKTPEAKVYKALDSLEALIQHNLSEISTWSDNEKTFNLTYADERVTFSAFLTELREEIRKDTLIKVKSEP